MLLIKPCNGSPLHVSIDVHILHHSADFGVVHQFLEYFSLATTADEFSSKRLAADVVMQVRLDAQLQPNSRQCPVLILVGAVAETGPAFLVLRVAEVTQPAPGA